MFAKTKTATIFVCVCAEKIWIGYENNGWQERRKRQPTNKRVRSVTCNEFLSHARLMASILAREPNLFLCKTLENLSSNETGGFSRKKLSVRNCIAFFDLLYFNTCHPPWAMRTSGKSTEISILLANRNFQIAKFINT